MVKQTSDAFILELKLSVLPWQCHRLQTRFEIARRLYNTTLSYALKQLALMKESKPYRKNIHAYRTTKSLLKRNASKEEKHDYQNELKSIANSLTTIRQSYGLTKFGLHDAIATHQRNYKMHIDSHTAQKIADAVWKAIEDVLFKGSKAHFKKYGSITSVEAKTNQAGIRFKDHTLRWLGMELPVIIRKNDLFAQACFEHPHIKFCRMVKKVIRGKDAFYVQLVMEGTPPVKRVHTTGAFRHPLSPNKRVGIDIGTSTVAVSSEKAVFLQPLAPKVPQFEKEKRCLLRKLDRSRRQTNLTHFHADGTVKQGVKLTWHRSHHYMKTLYQLKELHRKKVVYVKEQHARIANQILSCGNDIYVEKMHFKGLSRRAKETIRNKKGTYQRKKRFGKSISSFAPAMLIAIIKQKLGYINKELHLVNTYTFKASQYNHITDIFQKKKLHQRWTTIGNHRIQRDLYSAFLLMNSETHLKHTNQALCRQNFEPFVKLHDPYMKNLKQQPFRLPSSMGISVTK